MKKNEIEPNFLLDIALRHMYYRLEANEARLLAIKFSHRGREYVVDTPEEAAKLSHLLEQEDEVRAERDAEFARKLTVEKSGWTEEKFRSVINGAGRLQMRMLVALKKAEEFWGDPQIDAETLAETIGLPSQLALAGVVTGLSKQLKKLNIKPSEVYQVETWWCGKQKEREFRLSPGFQIIASTVSWESADMAVEEMREIEHELTASRSRQPKKKK